MVTLVNYSRKPPNTIGFMGLGFKSAYEITEFPKPILRSAMDRTRSTDWAAVLI